MKLISIATTILLSVMIFTSCSKTPQDPYFDRAKQASQDAQNQLSKD
ncbi:MAG: hypothetical protein H8E76_10485 [Helicobacteraceae bacterium]|nr:hypothetical protein [Candidatus Sulfurimonas ponti]MBL6973384.1 hypothetical protein [Sulfurimonas sp.]